MRVSPYTNTFEYKLAPNLVNQADNINTSSTELSEIYDEFSLNYHSNINLVDSIWKLLKMAPKIEFSISIIYWSGPSALTDSQLHNTLSRPTKFTFNSKSYLVITSKNYFCTTPDNLYRWPISQFNQYCYTALYLPPDPFFQYAHQFIFILKSCTAGCSF